MDAALAEFVGILLGDGSIGVYNCTANGKPKMHYRVKITLNSEDDRYYIAYVSKLIHNLFGIWPIVRKRPGEKAVDILIFKRTVIRFLLSLGLRKAPKWKRACIPPEFLSSEFLPLVLRGYFDTDGCITIANNNGVRYPRLEMKICPSPMQKQLTIALCELGFHPRVYKIGRGKVRVVLAGIANLKMWNERIGFSNRKNMLRFESFDNNTRNKKDSGRWIANPNQNPWSEFLNQRSFPCKSKLLVASGL